MAGDDELGGIEVVLLRLGVDLAQEAAAVGDCAWGEGVSGQAVLDLESSHAVAEIGQQAEDRRLFGSADPAAAVDIDDGRDRPFSLAGNVEVDLVFVAVGGGVDDVGVDAVLVGEDGGLVLDGVGC